MTFCGVNAHYQNDKAERRVKDLTSNSRTSLFYVAHRWPKASHVSLWSSALKNYTILRNNILTTYIPGTKGSNKTTRLQYTISALLKCSGQESTPNLNHFYPFDSPIYVLGKSLQAQNPHNKRSDRSRAGIFPTHSPEHASNFPLIWITNTTHVSPQFHHIYDDEFATGRTDAKFTYLWYYKAKFHKFSTNVIQFLK